MKNLFGSFVQLGINENLTQIELDKFLSEFRDIIWGVNYGIDLKLKKFNCENYGKDIEYILIKYYVLPSSDELDFIKDIENYRKSDRSFALSIVIKDDFFELTLDKKYSFIQKEILKRIKDIGTISNKKKLNFYGDLLITDLTQFFQNTENF